MSSGDKHWDVKIDEYNRPESTMKYDENKPHADDRKTLSQIGDIGAATGDHRDALEDAYHLGRIRGRMEGVESALSKMPGTL